MASGVPSNQVWYGNSNGSDVPVHGLNGASAASGLMGGTYAGMIGSPGQLGGLMTPNPNNSPWYQIQPTVFKPPQATPFVVSAPQLALLSEMEALKQRMAELEAQLAELLPKKELLAGAPADGAGRVVEL
jgi:hypothetical protein